MVVAVGFTLIEAPIIPLDHFTRPLHPVEVSVTESPEQITVLVLEMIGAVGTATLIVTVFDGPLWQTLVRQVAVKLVVAFSVTRIELPVAPFDHLTVPAQLGAVSIAIPPAHTDDVFDAITGGIGVVTLIV